MAKLEGIAKTLPADQAASLTNSLAMFQTAAEGMGGAVQDMAKGMAKTMTNAPGQVDQTKQAAEQEAGGDVHPVIAIVRGMYADAYAVKSAAALARQSLRHLPASRTGCPRNRPDNFGGGPSGYFIVWCPCCRRARIILSMVLPYRLSGGAKLLLPPVIDHVRNRTN